MPVQVQAFFHHPTSTVSYLVWDEQTKAAALIDPVLDYEPKAAKVTTAAADAPRWRWRRKDARNAGRGRVGSVRTRISCPPCPTSM